MPPSPPDTHAPVSARDQAIRVTLIGSVLDLSLGLGKILIGTMAGSLALISDGIHSLSDLVTDGFVLLMARIAHQAPDAEHPYGHRRFETLGTIVIGIALFIIAGVICYDSVRRLLSGATPAVPGGLALVVTLISIASKEWIYRYTRRVALRIDSAMLLANAWHSRTDAFSSIAVLIGILGAWLGLPWMDLVAAIAVGLMIGHIAWRLMDSSVRELVDTALPAERLDAIRKHILDQAGIQGVHSLRSRQHAGQTFLDIHVQVPDRISVSEGHHLGDCIIRSLKARFPDIADVLIHVDPELDGEYTGARLPLRQEVMQTLLTRWEGLLREEDVERVVLHYLRDKVQAEVFITKEGCDKELRNKLESLVKNVEWLDQLQFYTRCHNPDP